MQVHEITKYLKLPFQFEEKKLAEELKLVLNSEWVPHFNNDGYEGSWNSIALYAKEGDQKNIFAHGEENAAIIPTPILNNCDYLKEVIANFKCPLLSVRLLNLAPNSVIKPHRDFNLGYEDGCFRLHVPITTNPHVTFTLAEKDLDMNPGECWYTNVNHIHSVSNKGSSDRIHLVIDGKRNDWSDNLFFSIVPKESLLTVEQPKYDSKTIQKMIVELEKSNLPASEQLIKDLRNQL